MEKRLESRHNPNIRSYRRLEKREARTKYGLFAAEGVRIVEELLRSTRKVTGLYLSDSLDEKVRSDLLDLLAGGPAGAGAAVYRVPDNIFRWMAHTVNPQGAAAVVRRPVFELTPAFLEVSGRILLLNQPNDPGNVGTILRSAEAAGFNGVIIIEPACDPFNPKAVRASMGSIFRLPVFQQTGLVKTVEILAASGFRVLAAEPRASRTLYEIEMTGSVAFLFGGETDGLPRIDLPELVRFSIPMTGGVESLNLAQAVTVSLYESYRRNVAGE